MGKRQVKNESALKEIKLPETDEEILLGIGKFGPYLKYMGKFTSIPKKLNPFEVTLKEAVTIIHDGKNKEKKTK